MRLARFNHAPFSTRLVRKLDLPVAGWRASSGAEAATPGIQSCQDAQDRQDQGALEGTRS